MIEEWGLRLLGSRLQEFRGLWFLSCGGYDIMAESPRSNPAFNSRFYAEQLLKAMARMHYLSGSFDPLLASISPKICEMDFCKCFTSNLG